MNNIISFKAGGNIAPSRFVILDTTSDKVVTQAGAGGITIGISQMGTRRTPLTGLDDGYAAISGDDLQVFCTGSHTLLELGGTVTPGARLKADADGKGVATTTNLDEWGAIALENGVSGGLCMVRVTPYGQISA